MKTLRQLSHDSWVWASHFCLYNFVRAAWQRHRLSETSPLIVNLSYCVHKGVQSYTALRHKFSPAIHPRLVCTGLSTGYWSSCPMGAM